ncbi:unnamed protein product [Xyrichtys novacula]|uniref:Unnamed protein product n=1 Tax=Xyrichtys novacula TaxID=13765 RepID=A0AAV1GEY4_XYRNO|nr:unnamed protein product [Xyrichtys novacula]
MTVNTSLTVVYWTFLLSDAYFKWVMEPEDKPKRENHSFMAHPSLKVLSFPSTKKRNEDQFQALNTRLDSWPQTSGG